MVNCNEFPPNQYQRDQRIVSFETPEHSCCKELKQVWVAAYCAAITTEQGEHNATFIADRAVEAYKEKFNL